ncbi:MAG: hypothetical protein ACRCTD_10310 [Beijerinckiaceae bacterium]
MTKPADVIALRMRLAAAGLPPADLRWLESIGFDDAAVPPVESEFVLADYERRAQALTAKAAELTLWERESAAESKLAAAIGARIADWKDRAEGEDDE